MKKINFHPSFLQVLFIVIYMALFAAIVLVPVIISGPLRITPKIIIEEEAIEGAIAGILFIISIVIFNLYKAEVQRHKTMIQKINDEKANVQSRLTDSYQYISLLNVQLQEIKTIFNSIDKYPETREELKKTLGFFCEHIHGIVKTDWVLFRIISRNSYRTLSEHYEPRKGVSAGFPHVSNKLIVEQQGSPNLSAVVSTAQNVSIWVVCVMPVAHISSEQGVFIQAVINEITKMFVIMNSVYFKKDGVVGNTAGTF